MTNGVTAKRHRRRAFPNGLLVSGDRVYFGENTLFGRAFTG
jgi:hypothetical protein